jgi:HSP20 family protein
MILYADAFIVNNYGVVKALRNQKQPVSMISPMSRTWAGKLGWPFKPMFAPLSRIFDEFWHDYEDESHESQSFVRFPMDVKETQDFYVLTCDIPGAKKEDINIEIEENFLRVSTERKKELIESTDVMHREERFQGIIMRSIKLPVNADENQVSASFQDGVLKIIVMKIPGVEKEKLVKSISVS